jgi:adenylate kinase family enzyme
MSARLLPCRLFITGASGSGTTTLGRAVAGRWAAPHADTDDYFWRPTTPPYTEKRPEPERVALMNDIFVPRDAWVLSGSVLGWGEALIPVFDAVVFLTLDPGVRMKRLEEREAVRMRAAAEPGLSARISEEFLEWARGYDDPGFAGRNHRRQEEWLAALPCPVIRLDSAHPVPRLVEEISRT